MPRSLATVPASPVRMCARIAINSKISLQSTVCIPFKHALRYRALCMPITRVGCRQCLVHSTSTRAVGRAQRQASFHQRHLTTNMTHLPAAPNRKNTYVQKKTDADIATHSGGPSCITLTYTLHRPRRQGAVGDTMPLRLSLPPPPAPGQ